jgi:predicted nucleic-acid-binding protein
MIGLDTNVLVRYIVEDDPEQSPAAAAMIERALKREEPIFIPQIVLCELVWVLSFAYRFKRDAIVGFLQQLRRGAQLVIEGADEVKRAIETYAAGRGDFADYLIAERSIANGCSVVASFDRALEADTRFAAPPRIAR